MGDPKNVEPEIYLVGRPDIDWSELDRFLVDHGLSWNGIATSDAESLVEAAGRVCYLSFGKGRKTNREYLEHLIQMKHGSVLEHAVWSFIIAGVSRSFTHELVRHRAGWSYSQLSQRYVDESDANLVEPDIIAENEFAHLMWMQATETAKQVYADLVKELSHGVTDGKLTTEQRKLVRQAARSVLPNAAETMVFCTANARAIRHFIELRGSAGADAEIRRVALTLLRLMQEEAPAIFRDYEIVEENGIEVVHTPNVKV